MEIHLLEYSEQVRTWGIQIPTVESDSAKSFPNWYHVSWEFITKLTKTVNEMERNGAIKRAVICEILDCFRNVDIECSRRDRFMSDISEYCLCGAISWTRLLTLVDHRLSKRWCHYMREWTRSQWTFTTGKRLYRSFFSARTFVTYIIEF